MAAFPNFDAVPQQNTLTLNYSMGTTKANAQTITMAAVKRATGAAFDLTNAASQTLDYQVPAALGWAGYSGSITPTTSGQGSGTIVASLTEAQATTMAGNVQGVTSVPQIVRGQWTLSASDSTPTPVIIASGNFIVNFIP